MKSLFFVAIALLFLTGCGTYVSTWEKPGATQDEERAIVKKCEYEAESNAQEGLTSNYSRQERVRKLRDMCLEANGMVRVKQEYEPAK